MLLCGNSGCRRAEGMKGDERVGMDQRMLQLQQLLQQRPQLPRMHIAAEAPAGAREDYWEPVEGAAAANIDTFTAASGVVASATTAKK